MCGIAGIFNLRSTRPVTAQELKAMTDTIVHRGPDAEGNYLFDGGGFGHRRLAILDLRPESNQPFVIDDGDYVLTFNGEIFNFVELRTELEGLGHVFHTTSDTEVLIKAYKQWGSACSSRFNGMWALAIYDRARDELFCSLDRFGIKPFYYAVVDGQFVFASEIKAMLAARPQLAEPNWDSLSRFLRAKIAAETEESYFRDIYRVRSAHNLFVTREGIRYERYWNYPTDRLEDIGAEEAAGRLRELLVDSLKLRMQSDVPVGSTLSGGIDSSAIVSLLRTFDQSEHHTFTASYPGEAVDESPRAARLSEHLGMINHPIRATTGEFLPLMRKIVYHMDAPNGNPGTMPLWNIMAQMRQTVTVALAGEGADELLAGYEYANLPYILAGAAVSRSPWRVFGHMRRFASLYGARFGALWIARALLPQTHKLYRSLRGDESIYVGPLAGLSDKLPASPDPAPRLADGLTRMLLRMHSGGLRSLLQRGDAVSMAHSVEARLPFMDYRIVEFVFRLPGNLKTRGGQNKAVLRDAIKDDVLPEVLEPRPKEGFTTPIERWFRDMQDKVVHPVLFSDRCRQRGIFDPGQLTRALQMHASGKVNLASQIFRWIGTEVWFQEFID